MNRKIIIGIVAWAFVSGVRCYGEEIPSSKEYAEPPVKIVSEKGRPMTATWPDGREASVVASYTPQMRATVSMTVIENLCNDKFNVNFSYTTSVKGASLSLIWTKNPDASRIGKQVIDPGNGPITEVGYYDDTMKVMGPSLGQGMDGTEIVASDYSWLPQGTVTTPPEKVDIALWNAEIMIRNRETGITENHAFEGGMNFKLLRTDHNSLQVESPRYILADFGYFGDALVGDTISIFVKDPTQNNNTCQISVKPAAQDLVKSYNDILALIKKQTPQPYIYESDVLYDYLQFFRMYLKGLNRPVTTTRYGKDVKYYIEAPVQ